MVYYPATSMLLSFGQPKFFLQKDEKEGEGESKQFQYQVHKVKYTLSVLAFRALCKKPCLDASPSLSLRHAPFCKHLVASDKSKLQAGTGKCTKCGSCSAPPGINGISTSSANGGRWPRIIPVRHEPV